MPTVKTVTPEQIKETIFSVLEQIAPEADLARLDPGKDLRNTLDLDSFDFLNLLIGLDEQLEVEIPEADYGQLSTLEDLIGYLSARVS